MAVFKRMCNGCYQTTRNDIQSYCPYCNGEYKKLKKLYTRIVGQRPHLRKLHPSELFQRLWAAYQRLEQENGTRNNSTSSDYE